MRSIGLRNIKTALAVLITLMFSLLLTQIDSNFSRSFYSPFFASIAAAYSVQKDSNESFKLAKIRSIGSIVGGLFGLVLVFSYESLLMDIIISKYDNDMHLFMLYSLTGIFVIPLILMLNKLKFNDYIFIALLTYLSVTISIRNNLDVFTFATNRISSTIIGVMIALGVNHFRIHLFKHKEILFVSGLDGCLLNKDNKLSSFTNYTLNKLIKDGMDFTVSTTRTPASLSNIFKGVSIKEDMMIMNGAVRYQILDHTYKHIHFIDKDVQIGIDSYFKKINRNIFTFTIVDQVLSIYHTIFENEAEELYYHHRKNNYFKNHVKGRLHEHDHAVYYLLIDRYDKVNQYLSDLNNKFEGKINGQIEVYPWIEGFYYLRIYASQISKYEALKDFIKEKDKSIIITFGSKIHDLEMIKLSDFSIALKTSDQEVIKHVSHVIDSDDPDSVVKLMHKIYYSKNPQKYIDELNK